MGENFEKLKQMHLRSSVGIGIFLALIPVMIVTFLLLDVYGFIPLGLMVICGIIAFPSYKKYTKLFKETIVRSALEEIFTDLSFTPKYGIPSDVVYGTGMIQRGDIYSSNDLVTGKYNGVAFTQSDVVIEDQTTDSDGNTSTTTIFSGRWMIYEFNKEFVCDLQIMTKNFFGSVRKGGLFAKREEKSSRIKFENEEFNKKFKVFANNEHEAFYLITPHIMETLMDLQNKLKAPLMLMFVGGKLHIAVNNHKDAFEAKLFGKFDPQKEKLRVIDETHIITDFIDGMAMERDIYKY